MPRPRAVNGGTASCQLPFFQPRLELSKPARTWKRLSTVRSASTILPPFSMLDWPKKKKIKKLGFCKKAVVAKKVKTASKTDFIFITTVGWRKNDLFRGSRTD